MREECSGFGVGPDLPIDVLHVLPVFWILPQHVATV